MIITLCLQIAESAWLRGWRSDSLLDSLSSWMSTLIRIKEKLELNRGYTTEGPLNKKCIRELEPEANFTDMIDSNGPGPGHIYYFADEGRVNSHLIFEEVHEIRYSRYSKQRLSCIVREICIIIIIIINIIIVVVELLLLLMFLFLLLLMIIMIIVLVVGTVKCAFEVTRCNVY